MAPPKVKQYLFQLSDEEHALRLSLTIPAGSHASLVSTAPHDALELRHTASTVSDRKGSAINGRSATASQSATAASHVGADPSLSLVNNNSVTAAPSTHPDIVQIHGSTWSMFEDKLITRCDDAKSDIVANYATFHKMNPVLYPKMFQDAAPFKERLQELQGDSVRMKMLQLLPDDSIAQGDEPLNGTTLGSAPRAGSGLPQKTRAIALNALRKTPNGKQQHHVYRKEDVILQGIVRQGTEQQELLCCSEDICPQSPLIKELFQRSTDFQTSGAKRVVLSEKDQMWASIPDMCSVFASDNLQRLKQFCEAPHVLQGFVAANEKLQNAEKSLAEEWNSFVSGVFEKRDEQLALLDGLEKQSLDSTKKRLDDCMERDFESIREIYKSHFSREEQKLKGYFEHQRVSMEQFYEREVATMSTLKGALGKDADGLADLRAETAALAELSHDTFGPAHLPRLLMLADVVLCSELRTQCLKLIAQDFGKFVTASELSSELIRANTFRELMTFVPDLELLKAQRFIQAKGPMHNGVPAVFVDKEVRERGDARAQELLKMELIQIQDLARRVNALSVRNKMNVQAAGAASPPPASLASPRTSIIPRGQSLAGGSLVSDPRHQHMIRAAVASRSLRPATIEDLRKGETVEELYLNWRDLLHEALTRKLQQGGSSNNVAILRLPRGMEGYCSLLDHKRGFDAKHPLRYLSAEGQGCVVIGESNYLLYWETRIIFVDGGLRFPANVAIGMDPVAKCLNAPQVEHVKKILMRESAEVTRGAAVAQERMNHAKEEANPLLGPSAAAVQSALQAQSNLLTLLKSFSPLIEASNSTMAKERIVGVTTTNVSSQQATPVHLHGVSWSNEGVFNVDGVPLDVRVTYDVGDYVGVTVNTLNGEVKLYKNGAPLQLDKNLTWPRLRQTVAYQPCVTVYSTLLPLAQSSVFLNQQAPPDEDSVVVSLSGANPKVRVMVDMEGRGKSMPAGAIPFAKAAFPLSMVQK